jgi:hypothetical protein
LGRILSADAFHTCTIEGWADLTKKNNTIPAITGLMNKYPWWTPSAAGEKKNEAYLFEEKSTFIVKQKPMPKGKCHKK